VRQRLFERNLGAVHKARKTGSAVIAEIRMGRLRSHLLACTPIRSPSTRTFRSIAQQPAERAGDVLQNAGHGGTPRFVHGPSAPRCYTVTDFCCPTLLQDWLHNTRKRRRVTNVRSIADSISVLAPARPHMGFVDLSGSLGRRFGSVGLYARGHRRYAECEGRSRYRASRPGVARRALRAIAQFFI
jgi:hypothetical protein